MEFARRDARLQNSQPMKLEKTKGSKERLHIVYVMTWTGICGGSKIILQHCNQLVDAGHRISIVCYFPRPGWFSLNAAVTFIHVPRSKILCEHIPECDVIVATYWKEIYECIEQRIAPVIYFEQGDTHLFDPESMGANLLKHIRKQISLAPFVYTVSTFAAEKLKENYNVKAHIIPNAVDKTIFYPASSAKKAAGKIVITTIGSEHIAFKCVFNVVVAVTLLKKLGHDVEFVWISPDTPSKLTTVPVKINPSQKEIGDYLRSSHIYVCASLYESFCLPVLEAMTCGVAVVTTDNGGIRDFVRDKVNALVADKNNIADMVEKLTILIDDVNLRENLSAEGMKSAQAFDWSQTVDSLVSYYQDIARYQIQ